MVSSLIFSERIAVFFRKESSFLFSIKDNMFTTFFLVSLLVMNGVAGASIFSLVHDTIQDNIAGRPVIHQKTVWDFDPDVGKQRRVQFEALNGRLGEDLIARVGMGIGFKKPWGVVVSK